MGKESLAQQVKAGEMQVYPEEMCTESGKTGKDSAVLTGGGSSFHH